MRASSPMLGYQTCTRADPNLATTPAGRRRRNAFCLLPWTPYQSISHAQTRLARQRINGAPGFSRFAKSAATLLRSSTQFNPPKFEKAPSNCSRESWFNCSVGSKRNSIAALGASIALRDCATAIIRGELSQARTDSPRSCKKESIFASTAVDLQNVLSVRECPLQNAPHLRALCLPNQRSREYLVVGIGENVEGRRGLHLDISHALPSKLAV